MPVDGPGSKPLGDVAQLTRRDALVRAQSFLTEGGIESAAVDARRLLAASLKATSLDLLREPERVLTSVEVAQFQKALRRRAAHEPVSRILGERAFYGRDFCVTPDTLDPRPCTETVIDAVLQVLDGAGARDKPLKILDVGTGTGCLILTLLAELPQARGLATDISEPALAVAAENAARLGLSDRVSFQTASYLQDLCTTADVLVSNPPYIVSSEITDLEPDVRAFDPLAALDGGADGLDAYRALADGLCAVVPAGWSFFEVGAGQAADVSDILVKSVSCAQASSLRRWTDLGGHERCVSLQTHHVT